jgi:hypothetical protein
MIRFIVVLVATLTAGELLAAPPAAPDAQALVARLSSPSEKIREAAADVLWDRPEAGPWLRRAARSADKIAATRATALLAPLAARRQRAVPAALDSCLRDGRIDLLTEWHQFWEPSEEDDLWPIGRRAAAPGLELLSKYCLAQEWTFVQNMQATADERVKTGPLFVLNGPCPQELMNGKGVWSIRTDRMDLTKYPPRDVRFASVGGPARLGAGRSGKYLVLGPVRAGILDTVFVACDNDVSSGMVEFGNWPGFGLDVIRCVIVCRGTFTSCRVRSSVVLVDGDVKLLPTAELRNSVIRARGEITPPNARNPPVNCTIEAHAKNPTAPYKFFELTDVGLDWADDEEGLVVRGTAPDSPFGTCGLAKDDVLLTIDGADVGHSEQFRKLVRRAVVRQGDCLLTVRRGTKTLDLPVFFPLPK